jgi:glutathione peroxidase
MNMILFGLFGLFTMNKVTKIEKQQTPPESIYEIQIQTLDGSVLDLSQYKGKKLLIVNVASKCGLTPQYEELQQLHDQYGDKVTIVGVPCNQFMNQEPGSSEEIAEFCSKNYGVTFQLTEKVDVKGKEQHPLYQWLTKKEKNGVQDSDVSWNFQKYLIDEEGKLKVVFSPRTTPMSAEVIDQIK